MCTFSNSDPYLRQKILQCRHCLRHVVWAMTFNHRSYHGPHWRPLVARLKLFDTTETILVGALLQRHGLSLNIVPELVCKIENLWMLLTMIMITIITIILNLPHKNPQKILKASQGRKVKNLFKRLGCFVSSNFCWKTKCSDLVIFLSKLVHQLCLIGERL